MNDAELNELMGFTKPTHPAPRVKKSFRIGPNPGKFPGLKQVTCSWCRVVMKRETRERYICGKCGTHKWIMPSKSPRRNLGTPPSCIKVK